MNTKNRNKKQTFIEGAAILVAATAIVKVLGAIFKIPLGNLIGPLGMGYFQTAYGLYLPVYTVALAGMPVAVCRMVAERMAQQQYGAARQILRVARRPFFLIGLAGTAFLLIFSYPYLLLIGKTSDAMPGMIMVAPCVLFCCIMSTYRGYYEGMSNMKPTAVSQIIEALGKVVLGLGFAFLFYLFGMSAAWQAAGAILGIMIGTLLGALYISMRQRILGDGFTAEQLRGAPATENNRQVLRMLLTIAVPVILGSLASQIASLVDVTTVQRRLADLVNSNPDYIRQAFPDMWNSLSADPDITSTQKLLEAIPTYLYGCYSGYAFSIYGLIPNITAVLGVSALPIMTTAWRERKKRDVRRTFESVVRITCLIALPAGLGISALSGGILNLLYASKPIGAAISTPALTVLGFAVVFGALSLPMTNLLQAIGKERIPVYNLLVGALIKIVANYVLVAIPSVNIKGAAISTLLCYVYITVMDIYFLCKYTKVIPNLFSCLIKPLFAASLCGVGAWVFDALFSRFLPGKIATVIAILFAIAIYCLALAWLRAFSRDDILMLPKGQKIAKVLEKFHMIG